MMPICLVLLLAAGEPVPKYKYRPLGYWMDRLEIAVTDQERADAVTAVKAFGADAAPAVPKLLGMLADHSPEYRSDVVAMLKALGPAGKGAVPELIRRLVEKKARDPHDVLTVFRVIGSAAATALPVLASDLTHADLRVPATQTICRTGAAAEPVLPLIRRAIGKAVRDKDSWTGYCLMRPA